MYKSVVFDLDGTLLNTIDDISNSMNLALNSLGLKTHEKEEYFYFVGNGMKILAERAVGEENLQFAQEVAQRYQQDYQKNNTNLTNPYPGIRTMLHTLNKKRIPIAVLSNKPHKDTKKVVEFYFSDIIFSCIRGQLEEVPVKPHQQGALEIAQLLRLKPQEFLFVGDTAVDMECANNAHMHAVGVTWGFRQKKELIESGAEFIVNAPEEILRLI